MTGRNAPTRQSMPAATPVRALLTESEFRELSKSVLDKPAVKNISGL